MTGSEYRANEGEVVYIDWDEPVEDDYWVDEESEAEARDRMTDEEKACDAVYVEAVLQGTLDGWPDPFA